MAIYESGRRSDLLDDIIAGHKTVEGRLNRGKFSSYRTGDYVWLGRDTSEGRLPRQQLVKILGVTPYDSFREMLADIGYETVIPRAQSIDEALMDYQRFYTSNEEQQYGVLAIHIELADSGDVQE